MQLFKVSKSNIFYLITYAFLNSILSFSIIYIINNALIGKEGFLKDYMGLVFTATFVYAFLLNVIFQKHLNYYSFTLLYNNEKQLFTKMLETPLRVFERLGSQRFFTAIEDLRIFSFLPYTITHTVNSLLMLALGLVYMYTISFYGGVIVSCLIIIIAFFYFLVVNSMSKKVKTLRAFNDEYYKYVDDVIKGFKELKVNSLRQSHLLNRYLYSNREKAGNLDYRINYVFLSINLISQYGLYFVIALILFVLPEFGLLKREDVISYIIILLFISGPINNLINLQQMYTRFMVANKRINSFLKDFPSNQQKSPVIREKSNFKNLSFQNIQFSFLNEENPFVLGPIDIKIKKGEVIFIIGGNGSGKSTFINLLTGLYEPTKGEIEINNTQILSKEDVQNLVSVVFTNNHIFSHNYEDYTTEGNVKYKELIKLMKLDQVIKDDREVSARRGLSKGQSKRMALIFALLENKPILILDEWAADQDPYFRKFFYENLIPKLKAEGKTIIAVTHDDAYYDQADRILKFDYGKIIKEWTPRERSIVSKKEL